MALINLKINLAHLNTFCYLDSDPSSLTWRLTFPWGLIRVSVTQRSKGEGNSCVVSSWPHLGGAHSGGFLGCIWFVSCRTTL